jgi:hypothetical protein
MKIRKARPAASPRDPSIAWPTAERQRQGAFVEARTYEFDPAEPGGASVRRTVRTLRDLNANVATRLAKCGLTQDQLTAAVLYERDHETARLEPRLTVNLRAIGGGGPLSDDLPERVQDARNREYQARGALHLAGPDLVALVDAILLTGIAVTTVRSARDADRRAAKARTMTTLEIGLNLLCAHYRATGRIA